MLEYLYSRCEGVAKTGNIEKIIQQGLACEAMDRARGSRHDGADAAFCSIWRSRPGVGGLDGLFVDAGRRREGVVAAMRRRIVDADLFAG